MSQGRSVVGGVDVLARRWDVLLVSGRMSSIVVEALALALLNISEQEVVCGAIAVIDSIRSGGENLVLRPLSQWFL